MDAEIVLVPGPMVGASSWAPTAGRLRAAGMRVHVPDVLAALPGPPPWSAWSSHLMRQLPLHGEPILVGHSRACMLVAELASRLPARALIIVDGDIPPASGRAAPASDRLRRLVDTLADDEGRLPPWSDWWATDRLSSTAGYMGRVSSLIGVDALARDPVVLEAFRRDLPRLTVAWFDDAIEIAPWDHVPAGYVRTSALYDHSAEEAECRGWPVVRLQGTHLHPTLEPAETAAAIVEVSRKLSGMAG